MLRSECERLIDKIYTNKEPLTDDEFDAINTNIIRGVQVIVDYMTDPDACDEIVPDGDETVSGLDKALVDNGIMDWSDQVSFMIYSNDLYDHLNGNVRPIVSEFDRHSDYHLFRGAEPDVTDVDIADVVQDYAELGHYNYRQSYLIYGPRGYDQIFESRGYDGNDSLSAWLHGLADPQMESLARNYDLSKKSPISDDWLDICRRRKDILIGIVVDKDIGAGIDFMLENGLATVEELEQPVMESHSMACRSRYLERRAERPDLPVMTDDVYLPPVERVFKEDKDRMAWILNKSARWSDDESFRCFGKSKFSDMRSLKESDYTKALNDARSGNLSIRADMNARVLSVRKFYVDAENDLRAHIGSPESSWAAAWFKSLPADSLIKSSVARYNGYGMEDAINGQSRQFLAPGLFSMHDPDHVTADDFLKTLALFNRYTDEIALRADPIGLAAAQRTFMLDTMRSFSDPSYSPSMDRASKEFFDRSEVLDYLHAGEQYLNLPPSRMYRHMSTSFKDGHFYPEGVDINTPIPIWRYEGCGHNRYTFGQMRVDGQPYNVCFHSGFITPAADNDNDSQVRGFYDDEIWKLLLGESVPVTSASGKNLLVKLGPATFVDHEREDLHSVDVVVDDSQKWTILMSKKGEPYVNGQMNIDGEVRDVHFKKTFGIHEFDDDEIRGLLNGDKIAIPSRSGQPLTVKLGPMQYVGREGFGVVIDDSSKQSAGRRGLPSVGCQDDNQLGAGDDEDTPDN